MEYADGAARFLTGTPNVPALYAATAGYDLIEEVGVERIRANSLRQTQLLIDLADEAGFEVRSPRSTGAPRRNGHRPRARVRRRPSRARASAQILCDFRPDAGIRLGPHYFNSDDEHPLRDRRRSATSSRAARTSSTSAPSRDTKGCEHDERQDPVPDRGRGRPGRPLLGSARCAAAEGRGRFEPRAPAGSGCRGPTTSRRSSTPRPRLLRRFRGNFDLGQDFVFGIFCRRRERVLGGTGLHTRVGRRRRSRSATGFAPTPVRQGIATTVAGALTRVGIELAGADRIEIHVDVDNEVSCRVPRRLGYREEGILPAAPADARRLPATRRAHLLAVRRGPGRVAGCRVSATQRSTAAGCRSPSPARRPLDLEQVGDHHVVAADREVVGVRELLDPRDLLRVRLEDRHRTGRSCSRRRAP